MRSQPSSAPEQYQKSSWRRFLQVLGPGVITGAADNDPAGVVTYIQVGATTGFSLLWLMLLSTPLLYFLEEMSTRLGIVGKRGIGRMVRTEYGLSAALLIVLVFAISNTITIAADIVGMAAAAELLTGISWIWFVAPVAAFIAYVLLWGNYQQVNRFLLLLTPIFFLYILTGFVSLPDWTEVLGNTFVPHLDFSAGYFLSALGLLGATLTPYIFFWQATEQVELRRGIADMQHEKMDVAIGMTFANAIFYFIVVSGGATLFKEGVSVSTIGDAASALRPVAGDLAFVLFSIGIFASGIIAIPILAASTGYALADVAGWTKGLDKRIDQAPDFYLALLLALLLGVIVAVIGIPPTLLMFWSQVLNGLLLPILLYFIMRLANNPKVLRKHANGRIANAFGALTIVITATLAILTLVDLVRVIAVAP